MKITVTAHDIKNGSRNVCTMCPVARALARAVGLPEITPQNASRWTAYAQPSRLLAASDNHKILCDTPPDVRDRIIAWDDTGKMEPFEFDVESTTGRVLFQEAFPGLGLLVGMRTGP